MKKSILLIAALLMCASVFGQDPTRLNTSTPAQMGMDPVRLGRVDQVINQAINNRIVPGAVICVVRKDKIVYLKAYVNKSVYPKV